MARTLLNKALSVGIAIVLVAYSLPLSAQPAMALDEGGLAAAAVSSTQTQQTQQEQISTQATSSNQDIVLAMFTGSLTDWTNNIFASYDGETMYRIASVYESKADEPYMDSHYAQQCPSIMYHDGYFWSLSAWNRNDGKFWPLISYSKDLVHWTHPEGDSLLNGTRGIEVNKLPGYNGEEFKKFDVVAPEWSKASDGSIYIVFSAGYYGDYHGKPFQDQMQAYTVKVNTLFAFDGLADGDSGYLWPNGLAFEAETAKKLSFTNKKGANFIDGQIFADKGKDYLIIKKNGLTNQLYATDDIEDASGWTLVNGSMTYGYEGASLVKFNGKYLMYTDGVLGTKPLGVHMVSSKSLTKTKSWGEPKDAIYLSESDDLLDTRHGTAIVLKAGTEEWTYAKNILDSQERRTGGVMYRLYNPHSGEHFYTASGLEAGSTKRAGWRYEDIAWYAPTKSSKPVYRLYNKYAGDHHYTKSKKEYNQLAKAGWKKEGIAWYSAGSSGVPLYRAYNKNAKAGAHHYTTSKAELRGLKRAGWKAEGIGWYGLK